MPCTDVIGEIYTFCEIQEILSFSACCKDCKLSETMWNMLLWRDFGKRGGRDDYKKAHHLIQLFSLSKEIKDETLEKNGFVLVGDRWVWKNIGDMYINEYIEYANCFDAFPSFLIFSCEEYSVLPSVFVQMKTTTASNRLYKLPISLFQKWYDFVHGDGSFLVEIKRRAHCKNQDVMEFFENNHWYS